MLGAELVDDPKIKLLHYSSTTTLLKGCTAMQTLYAIVQLRSNIHHENGNLHYRYDLETKLALVMNTKVVPYDILNMFRVLLTYHMHFIHWSHISTS